jgi:hypothetical protein
MSHTSGIYPDDFAEVMKKHAGQKYQPSNGTEGECFFEGWCCRCARDKSMSEGKDYDSCSDDEICEIIGATMRHSPEDEEYPKEWIYGEDGQPKCTAFIPHGDRIVFRDPLTADMFGKDGQ